MTYLKMSDWKFWAWLAGTVAAILVAGWLLSAPSANAATSGCYYDPATYEMCEKYGYSSGPDSSNTTAEDWKCFAIAGLSGAGVVGATVSTGGTFGAAAAPAAWSAVSTGAGCYVGQM